MSRFCCSGLLTVLMCTFSGNAWAGKSTIVMMGGSKAAPKKTAPVKTKPRPQARSTPKTLPKTATAQRSASVAPRRLPPELQHLIPAATPAPLAVTAAPTPPSRVPGWLPWTTLGASVVLGALGTAYAIQASETFDDPALNFSASAAPSSAQLDRFKQAQQDALNQSLTSSVLLSSAAVTAITSVIFFALE